MIRTIIGLLTTAFILAKVFGVAPVAAWSWWLVFTPALIYVGAALVPVLFGLIWAAITG